MTLAGQILSALAFCHSKCIAHRDIKPGNILIDISGHIKLSDFGISIVGANKEYNAFSGSLLYEPPEIITKKPHNPIYADIWSLGVLFAYMINGRTPWRCDNVASLKNKICSGSFKLKANTPPVVAELISKMIVVNPEERISAAELLRHPLFSSSTTIRKHDSGTICDVLSPRGRALTQLEFVKNKTSENYENVKSLKLYKMNIFVGNSKLILFSL